MNKTSLNNFLLNLSVVFEVFKSFVHGNIDAMIVLIKKTWRKMFAVFLCAIASCSDMICTWGKQNKKLVEFFSRWVY